MKIKNMFLKHYKSKRTKFIERVGLQQLKQVSVTQNPPHFQLLTVLFTSGPKT